MMRLLLIFVISFQLHAFSFEVDTSNLGIPLSDDETGHYFVKRRWVSIAAWVMGAALLTYLSKQSRDPNYQEYWQVFGVGLLPVLALNDREKSLEGEYSVAKLETRIRLLPMFTEVKENHFVPGIQLTIDF